MKSFSILHWELGAAVASATLFEDEVSTGSAATGSHFIVILQVVRRNPVAALPVLML